MSQRKINLIVGAAVAVFFYAIMAALMQLPLLALVSPVLAVALVAALILYKTRTPKPHQAAHHSRRLHRHIRVRPHNYPY